MKFDHLTERLHPQVTGARQRRLHHWSIQIMAMLCVFCPHWIQDGASRSRLGGGVCDLLCLTCSHMESRLKLFFSASGLSTNPDNSTHQKLLSNKLPVVKTGASKSTTIRKVVTKFIAVKVPAGSSFVCWPFSSSLAFAVRCNAFGHYDNAPFCQNDEWKYLKIKINCIDKMLIKIF